MWLFLVGLLVQVLGGVAAIVARRASSAHRLGAGAAVVGSLIAATGTAASLVGRMPSSIRLPWQVPYGAFDLGIDALSALFLLAIFVVGSASAVYGVSYLGEQPGARRIGASWFFFNTLLASMAVVVTSRNAVLFLAAWEAMSLSSFFLVTFDHERDNVRAAGWLYLVASHLGTALLIALFVVLGRDAGSLDFEAFRASPPHGGVAAVAFILALVGFGVKAGFIPVHVWLPEAHPAAPSHVSALMSGVMIKTGIYGIVRTMGWLGPAQAWWGWTLVAIGLTSGILGVLFALAQHDLKRLLAYHSVENVGIIALGVGLGVVGAATGHRALAVAGFAGGLLHVLNHALFKGLLFLGAGAVIHATGSRQLEHLGGLNRRMPFTGAAFFLGAVAIVGLPPLNGFVSELLVYLAALDGGRHVGVEPAAVFLASAAGLALIGGLAAACFVKAFGVVFLGVERRPLTGHVADPPLGMKVGMALLGLGCVAIGLLSPFAVRAMAPVVAQASALPYATAASELAARAGVFWHVGAIAWAVLLLSAALWALRAWLLKGRSVQRAPTWDCGYTAPTARMQYTASSFAQPLLELFGAVIRSSRHEHLPVGAFPKSASFATHEHDLWKEQVFDGLFRRASAFFDRFHWIQQGNVQLYVLYVVVTLVGFLLWKLH